MKAFCRSYNEYTKRMKVIVNKIHGSKFRLYCFLVLNIVRLVGRKYNKDNRGIDESMRKIKNLVTQSGKSE